MKIKKMADGGPTYPLYGNQRIQNNTAPSIAQKFVPPAPMMPTPGQNPIGNPMLNQGMNQPIPQGMKKGGRVGMKEGGSILKTEMAKLDKASAKAPLGRRNFKETMRDLSIDKRRAAAEKGDNSEAFSLMGDSISKRKDIEGDNYRKELSTGERESLENAKDAKLRAKESAGMKKAKGGTVKMAKGGSASSRADGIAQRGKTKGRLV
jgi:hypothetical protein